MIRFIGSYLKGRYGINRDRFTYQLPFLRNYTFTVSRGIAGRIAKDDIIEDFENSRYGFYWWFWLPVYMSNGGSIKRREVVDISVSFLCFWCGVILWPKNND